MNRLDTELHRLYLPHTPPAGEAGGQNPSLTAPDGRVRTLVLGVARPAEWDVLLRVWQGVQAELGWPAPAIAISGTDGHQLWFSLAEPVSLVRAAQCLSALRERYLHGVRPERVLAWPSEALGSHPVAECPGLPGRECQPGQWSAWVAPDLARIFEDQPWLDMPPGADAQAEVLARLQPLALADLQRVLPPNRPTAPGPQAEAPDAPPQVAGQLGPHAFLLQVMNDPGVDMRWRMEAAKALLSVGLGDGVDEVLK